MGFSVPALGATLLYSNPLSGSLEAGSLSSTSGPLYADPFSISGGGAVNHVRFYGTVANLALLGFRVSIFNDAGGKPGAMLAQNTGLAQYIDTGQKDASGAEILLFDFDITEFDAAAGDNYHIAIGGAGGQGFAWLGGSGCCASVSASGGGGDWQPPTGKGGASQAFDLLGPGGEGGSQFSLFAAVAVVPEPSAWALMILGIGGVGAVLRGRRSLALARA